MLTLENTDSARAYRWVKQGVVPSSSWLKSSSNMSISSIEEGMCPNCSSQMVNVPKQQEDKAQLSADSSIHEQQQKTSAAAIRLLTMDGEKKKVRFRQDAPSEIAKDDATHVKQNAVQLLTMYW